MNRKGIILAGGTGSRLFPTTLALSKHLLPVYDKPMIYYPLSTLMIAGIRKISIVSTPRDMPLFQELIGDGSQWGLEICYAIQSSPSGLAHALVGCKKFVANSHIALILGDNLFLGNELHARLNNHLEPTEGATIFAHPVDLPNRYGVVVLDQHGNALDLEEKPLRARSNLAITGFYLYDALAIELAESLSPSKRGEFEITDLNTLYLRRGKLTVEILETQGSWMDVGTHDSLLNASNVIFEMEKKHGRQLACLEEIAFRKNWIGPKELNCFIDRYSNCEYGDYLRSIRDYAKCD